MKATDILENLEKRPFTPLRFFIADGTVCDVRHRQQCMVGETSIVIGVSSINDSPPYDRIIPFGCEHVVRIEPIELPTVKSNGQHPSA
jgi:hypothetical protein